MFLSLAPVPAMAGNTVVYDNGQPDGNDGWTINYGFAVADSFKLSSPANVDAVRFAVDLIPGDTFQTVDWSIFSLGGNVNRVWGSGTANVFIEPGQGFGEYAAQFSFPGIELPAGTYWLRLSNATTSEGNPVYWWESGGPSQAFENSVGTIPSESFQIIDPPADSQSNATPATTPEPAGILLLGSGILGLAGLVRHKMGL